MPIYNTPKHFPGSQHLGELGQSLMERFFPADQIPTPSTVISPYGRIAIGSLEKIARASRPANEIAEEAASSYLQELIKKVTQEGLKTPVDIDIPMQGVHKGVPLLADGLHRILAGAKMGLSELPVKFSSYHGQGLRNIVEK